MFFMQYDFGISALSVRTYIGASLMLVLMFGLSDGVIMNTLFA